MSRKSSKDHLFLNLELIKNAQSKTNQQIYPTQIPNSVTKRRKPKSNHTKSTQQKIQQSYGQLMHYIDNLDERVQQIVKTYQVQFLQAYNNHIKKVKREMQELIHNSLNNANSQKALLQKIDSMEKQMKIFRQESLKLFDKLVTKEKQLNNANVKIKQLQKQNNQFQKTIYSLMKKNKQLQILNSNKLSETSIIKQIQEYNKNHNDKELTEPIINHRTTTMSYRSKSYYIQQKKNQKISKINDNQSNFASNKHTLILNQTEKRLQNHEAIKTARQIKSQSIPRNSHHKMDNQLKLKSFEFSQRDKYLKIFKKCVQQLRSQKNKNNKVVSLNFFKQNGPKNYVQFKKQDFYKLLNLLLSNQSILMQFYKIIFNRQAQF